MKLLIVAGGGGHFSAALAVIQRIPKDWEIVLVGRKYSFEKDKTVSLEYVTAQKMNIPFCELSSGRLQRHISLESVKSFGKIPFGFLNAFTILKKNKPDVVLSFGGYISVPIVFASAFLRIPIVLHEQTLHSGLANKISAKYVEKVCISFDSSRESFPTEKIVLTGNPMREEFLESITQQDKVKRPMPVIYVTGGSAGAHGINALIIGCLEKLLDKYIIIHQTGDARAYNDFETLSKLRDTLPLEVKKRYIITKFIEPAKVAHFIHEADLIISRSGMNTVLEILYAGKPSLLIPIPFGQKNEQQENAQFVKKLGLAEVYAQQDLSPQLLSRHIDNMFNNYQLYKKNALKGKRYVDIHAAEKVIKVVSNVKA